MNKIQFFNSVSKIKEDFKEIEEGKVSLYVCGPTVYDHCHLGHARAYVSFDILYRFLLFSGYDVTYVRNYTDVDDKIINRAKENGEDPSHLSERMIQSFKDDMSSLNVMSANHEPKVTENIDNIIDMIKDIESNNSAYCSVSGDVYYRTSEFDTYGKLSRKNIEELVAGARVDVSEQKESPTDFALWKSAKDGEVSWDSPWGKGRPGWHIECSAMIRNVLGKTIDIHGGGIDLIFPHHENEIAQSECANGEKFVNYWMHCGHLTIGNSKMAKSEGNFFTIKEIVKKYHPEALRHFVLHCHYRSPLEFQISYLNECEDRIEYLYKTKKLVQSWSEFEGADAYPDKDFVSLREDFSAAMNDDLGTPKALAAFNALLKMANEFGALKQKKIKRMGASFFDQFSRVFEDMASVLGIGIDDADNALRDLYGKRLADVDIEEEDILRKIEERKDFREDGKYQEADALREDLAKFGIDLLDGPEGTSWIIKRKV